MRKIILFGLLLICISNIIFCADNYLPSDSLYVWASNGLRLRSAPSTKSKIITTIQFGKLVEVIEKTNVSYNFNLIPGSTNINGKPSVDPIILYGHWVKVKVDSNLIGYVIDQYLLTIEPCNKGNNNEWSLELLQVDTMTKYQELPDGTFSYPKIKKTFQYNISEIESTGENWGDAFYTFPGFTIEEVLIFFSHTTDQFKNYNIVLMNWDTEKIISDNSCCEIRIKSEEGHISFNSTCGC